MRAKVISENEVEVTLGLDDGSCRNVPCSDLGFRALVGDEVDIFTYPDGSFKYLRVDRTTSSNGIINPVIQNIQYSYQVGSTTASSGKKRVNKVAYIIFAVLLGGLGAHKFYAGKIGLGIVYIALCWTFIPVIISLIEVIIALTKTSDENGMIEV